MPARKTFLALTLTLACSPGPSVSCQPTADQACSDWYGLTDPNALATLSTHELADTLNRMAQAYPLRSSWDPKALGRLPYRRFAAVLAQEPHRVQEVLARLRPDALAYLLDTCKLSGLTEVHTKALACQRTSRALSLFLAAAAGICVATLLAWHQPLAALGVLGLGAWSANYGSSAPHPSMAAFDPEDHLAEQQVCFDSILQYLVALCAPMLAVKYWPASQPLAQNDPLPAEGSSTPPPCLSPTGPSPQPTPRPPARPPSVRPGLLRQHEPLRGEEQRPASDDNEPPQAPNLQPTLGWCALALACGWAVYRVWQRCGYCPSEPLPQAATPQVTQPAPAQPLPQAPVHREPVSIPASLPQDTAAATPPAPRSRILAQVAALMCLILVVSPLFSWVQARAQDPPRQAPQEAL